MFIVLNLDYIIWLGKWILIILFKLQPLQLINYSLDIAKPGKLPSGRTEIPFEIPLKAKGNKELYETYHGVFVNIQVKGLHFCTKIIFVQNIINQTLKANLEKFVFCVIVYSLCIDTVNIFII